MDTRELEDVLRAIIVKNAGIPLETISDDQNLVRDLGFDSLAFILSLADLEQRLGVTISPERAEELAELSFRELVELVAREMAGGAASGTG